jgi:nucleotide-binding universal stress UspA family protein
MNFADVFVIEIVLEGHRRKGIERLFMGNSTEKVIGHAQKDILIVAM